MIAMASHAALQSFDVIHIFVFFNGGAEGDRTPDLRIANATLSQLSYGPVKLNLRMSAPQRGRRGFMVIAPRSVKRGSGTNADP